MNVEFNSFKLEFLKSNKNHSDFGHVLSFKIENDSENSSGVKSCVLLIFGAQIQIKVTLLEFPKIP